MNRSDKNSTAINKPVAKLVGENGNIFNLLGIASRALKHEGMKEEAEEMFSRVTTEARSYDEALQIIMDYVEVE